jgi:hypothetical protein
MTGPSLSDFLRGTPLDKHLKDAVDALADTITGAPTKDRSGEASDPVPTVSALFDLAATFIPRAAGAYAADLPEPPEPTTVGDPVALSERSRVYAYGNGKSVKLADVVELVVRPSGNHRVRTADGLLHIVAPGWLAIHIDDGGNGWTV